MRGFICFGIIVVQTGLLFCSLYESRVAVKRVNHLEQQVQSFIPPAYSFKECRACHKKGEKL